LYRIPSYAASVAGSIGSTIAASSFSGLLTRFEIGHIRIGAARNGRIKSRGAGSSLQPPGIVSGHQNDRNPVMNVGHRAHCHVNAKIVSSLAGTPDAFFAHFGAYDLKYAAIIGNSSFIRFLLCELT